MRPIDADALKIKIEQSDGEGTIARYCKRVLAECLDNDAPTIDAIPIDWLRSQIHNDSNNIEYVYDDICISELIEKWHKEQEARM